MHFTLRCKVHGLNLTETSSLPRSNLLQRNVVMRASQNAKIKKSKDPSHSVKAFVIDSGYSSRATIGKISDATQAENSASSEAGYSQNDCSIQISQQSGFATYKRIFDRHDECGAELFQGRDLWLVAVQVQSQLELISSQNLEIVNPHAYAKAPELLICKALADVVNEKSTKKHDLKVSTILKSGALICFISSSPSRVPSSEETLEYMSFIKSGIQEFGASVPQHEQLQESPFKRSIQCLNGHLLILEKNASHVIQGIQKGTQLCDLGEKRVVVESISSIGRSHFVGKTNLVKNGSRSQKFSFDPAFKNFILLVANQTNISLDFTHIQTIDRDHFSLKVSKKISQATDELNSLLKKFAEGGDLFE